MKTVNHLFIITLSILTLALTTSCSQKDGANTGDQGNTTNVTAQSNDKLISTDVVENTTAITFAKDSYDFGDIKQGDVVNHEFTFTNTGANPLIISSARGTCGCTVPEWPKEPIPPGGSGVINVQFNSKNKKGAQNKTVTVIANTTPSETKIYFTGTVVVPN